MSNIFRTISVADEAFKAARKHLETAAQTNKDIAKLDLVNGTKSLKDLQDIVTQLSSEYEEKRKSRYFRNYMVAFSRKVLNYKDVVDVFVSTHPEYAALVWGTMKLFFMVNTSESIL